MRKVKEGLEEKDGREKEAGRREYTRQREVGKAWDGKAEGTVRVGRTAAEKGRKAEAKGTDIKGLASNARK